MYLKKEQAETKLEDYKEKWNYRNYQRERLINIWQILVNGWKKYRMILFQRRL